MINEYMKIALKEAKKSLKTEDIPVGAVIVEKGKILAKAHNNREKKYKITGHAEINAIEKASKKKKTWHLPEAELYVTLQPCDMCIEAIKQSRITKIYYLIEQNKKVNYKKIKMYKLEDVENYQQLLKKFFKDKRK